MVRSPKNPQKYNWIFFLISIFIVLIATLYPFNFSKIVKFSIAEIVTSFDNSSSFQDQVNNILLFLPVGWSFGNLCQKSIKKITLQILLVILVSFGLSLTVEFLQIFLPSRSPTPADLLNNSLGGLFGFISFFIWNVKSFSSTVEKLELIPEKKSSKLIIYFFCGYLLLTLFISFLWQSTTNLSNWDRNYYLSIGNEITGNKAWVGYVSEISIVDRAISKNEASQVLADANHFDNFGNSLVAHYELNGECCYQDKTGNQPELLWQGKSASTPKSQGAFLSTSHWLKTSAPVSHLSQRMSQTSEFTIGTAIATSNVDQKGPARIISVSSSSQRRNWTLGQQGNSLDFRLRTPLTGENGTELKLNIPNVFTDTYLHHLVITYSRGNIQIYIDKLENFHSFNLLDLIPQEQRIFYYALTFMPLGIGLGIITFLARKKLIFYRILFYSGILIPSLMLEGILVSESGKDFSIKHLLLGISFTAVTMIFLRIRAARLKMIS